MTENRKEILKGLIRKLHEGADVEEVKRKFSEVLGNATSEEIARIEDELIKEGMPQEEIHKLCDVHLAVFKESLEKEKILAPEGHPIHILMEEHRILLDFAQKFNVLAKAMIVKSSFEKEDEAQLKDIITHFKESELHYLREENVLFPYIEKHGITGPPAVMWSEHDKIRGMKKNLYELIDTVTTRPFAQFTTNLAEGARSLAEMLQNHFYKENNILFPTSLKVIEEKEWGDIKEQFDEIGYCCFTPVSAQKSSGTKGKEELSVEGGIQFDSGRFTVDEMETLLNTLPVDITFVDTKDEVRYFSQGKDRIFVRTKAVIGRKVQQCHPQKSIHVVRKILDDFRAGTRDVAEFWIELGGKFIHIRYFAVRDKAGKYLGCLEVSQDVTGIRALKGEKRLLD